MAAAAAAAEHDNLTSVIFELLSSLLAQVWASAAPARPGPNRSRDKSAREQNAISIRVWPTEQDRSYLTVASERQVSAQSRPGESASIDQRAGCRVQACVCARLHSLALNAFIPRPEPGRPPGRGGATSPPSEALVSPWSGFNFCSRRHVGAARVCVCARLCVCVASTRTHTKGSCDSCPKLAPARRLHNGASEPGERRRLVRAIRRPLGSSARCRFRTPEARQARAAGEQIAPRARCSSI